MRMELTAVYQPVPEGGYIAWIDELPGALTQGGTLQETREMLSDAVRLLIDAARESSAQSAGAGAAETIREPLVLAD